MKRRKTELSTREILGLSQDHLALYLSVSRAHLGMYESGLRFLPHEASMKMMEIDKLVYINPIVTQNFVDANEAQKEVLLKTIKQMRLKCQVNLQRAKNKMDLLKKREQECKTAMMVVIELLPHVTADEKGRVDKELLEMMEILAKLKLDDCGAKAQALQKLKIEVLEFEMEKLGEMMK